MRPAVILFFYVITVSQILPDQFLKRDVRCPVVYNFHEITDRPGYYGVRPLYFEKIIRMLTLRGYEIRSFIDYYATSITRRANRKKMVVFTIDDGHRSAIDTAVPILMRYHAGATLFIYTDRYKNNSGFYRRLGALPSDFEIASHSLSHSNLLKIRDENKNQFYRELVLSKKKLEYYTGRRIKTFAWPYGNYNEDMIQSVFLAGYDFQVAAGILHRKNLTDRICGRFTVTRGTSLKKIEYVLNSETWE